MRIPTSLEMNGYVNKHISGICTCSFSSDAENHCAHFVCHATELRFGLTCFGMTGRGSRDSGANIRVQEVFPRCGRVGKWADKPTDVTQGLIFVIKGSNVNLQTKVMNNVPRKHIGIFIGQDVWQYRNRSRKVVKQTPTEFSQHYDYTGETGFEIFFGEYPTI